MMNNTKVMIRGVGLCTVQDSTGDPYKGLTSLSVLIPDGSEVIRLRDLSRIEYSVSPLYFTYTMKPSESPLLKGELFKKNIIAHYSLVDALKYMRRNPGSQLSITGIQK